MQGVDRNTIIETMLVSDIFVLPGRRPVLQKNVEDLAKSIKEFGLQSPIQVRIVPTYDHPEIGEIDGAAVLVAGNNRLAAMQLLGEKYIPCIVVDVADDEEAELWEISENLHRADLTQLERDIQVARWIQIMENRIVSAQVGHKLVGRPEGGVSAASRGIKVSRQDAERANLVASLTDEAKDAAVDLGLDDNRSALLAAAKVPAPQQAAKLYEIAERKKSSKIDGDIKADAAKQLAGLFAELCPAERWDWLKATLYAAGCKNVADELTNYVGAGSIMDRRYS